MSKKLVSLKEAATLVEDNDMLALGGNVLHRAPMAFVRELVRQGKRGLRIVKTAAAHDVDVLCAGGCVQSVDAGFVSYETEYGLAMFYRRAVESGEVKANEHACYTVISALRAAVTGVSFMPVCGLVTGDLLRYNDYFKIIEDPFSHEPVTLVKALVPDVAVIHVHECDARGNARIFGPKFEDVLISRAAKKLILTTEQIVPESRTRMQNFLIDIPYFLVKAIVHVPGGAAPGSCEGKYDIDKRQLKKFKTITNIDGFYDYIKGYEHKDRGQGRVGALL